MDNDSTGPLSAFSVYKNMKQSEDKCSPVANGNKSVANRKIRRHVVNGAQLERDFKVLRKLEKKQMKRPKVLAGKKLKMAVNVALDRTASDKSPCATKVLNQDEMSEALKKLTKSANIVSKGKKEKLKKARDSTTSTEAPLVGEVMHEKGDENCQGSMASESQKIHGIHFTPQLDSLKDKDYSVSSAHSGLEELPNSTTPGGKKSRAMEEKGSLQLGRECLGWILHPVKVAKFFKNSWERRPMKIKRGRSSYYKALFSTKVLDKLLRSEDKPLLHGKNLDITSYVNGTRETHNPGGRAYAPVVWDYYNNGCSVRLINPQTFHDPVWKICATLQEVFGCMVGANIYLTPPDSQGFAPHYDDVEVFILQLEGKKHWRVYEPRSVQETLPRYSSKNFSQDEIGDPCLETVLEAGDLLYLPRGTIHQADCSDDAHSLHITLSCHQLNTYGDLLERLIPAALSTAMEDDLNFRRGLPVDYLSYMGVVHSDKKSNQRQEFLERIESMMSSIFKYAPVDAAVDQMGKKFLHDSLPPFLSASESKRCVLRGGEKWHLKKARVVNVVEIDPESEIRLIRANCLRLVTEDDNVVRLYYNVENSREYHGMEQLPCLEVSADVANGIEFLVDSYPNYTTVDALPIESMAARMAIVQDLWERKLLLTRQTLEAHYDD